MKTNALLKIILSGLSGFYFITGFSQIPTGAWRDHLPYNHAKKLAEYDHRIFCSTIDGTLYSYDFRANSLKKHSKVNGLSDADISTIGVSESLNMFFVGYSNGNVDLIKNDSILNISDIKRKTMQGSKSINNVFILGNQAYLACDFGIVLLDMKRREIKETYFFGPNGTQIKVNDVSTDNSYLYAATDKGIFKARLDHPNLLDYTAWNKVLILPDPDASYQRLVSFNNRMFTIYSLAGNEDLIYFTDTEWNTWNDTEDNYESIVEQDGNFYVSMVDKTRIYNNQEQQIQEIRTYNAQYFLIDSNQKMWYAALYGGLVRTDEQGNGTVYAPEGAPYLEAADMESSGGDVWVGGGTFKAYGQGFGAYAFIDEKWLQYNRSTFPEMATFYNIAEIAIDPLNNKHVLGGSYGYGITEFLDGQLVNIEDEQDGVLKPVTGYENEPGYLRITGIDFDQSGNAYALGSESETALYKKPRGETSWQAIKLNFEGFGYNVTTHDLLVDASGQIWVLVRDILNSSNTRILVFTEENGESVKERSFNVKNQTGETFEYFSCLAEDKDGNIWLGTNMGPLVYYDPVRIFDEVSIIAKQPEIPRNDGTNYASLLLKSESINDIEVDGANRKWIATEKTGVYLVSENGEKEIHHFTSENSPLLSNAVRTVTVNDKSGEVFFGTDKGIIGYRGGATEAGDGFGDVYVFPNPVRENFTGDITITGLARDVNVKITDIAGNLVYETTALGGQAIWNGKNFTGQKVHTGIYMVFCTNEDGTQTYITKLLFIH